MDVATDSADETVNRPKALGNWSTDQTGDEPDETRKGTPLRVGWSTPPKGPVPLDADAWRR